MILDTILDILLFILIVANFIVRRIADRKNAKEKIALKAEISSLKEEVAKLTAGK